MTAQKVCFILVIFLILYLSFSESLSMGKRVAIIGGGASGMFCACSAASASFGKVDIHVLESSTKLMTKVEISGGGRCNVLHDTSKSVSYILNGYPRGKKELNGLLHKHFSPQDAEKWFATRGVQLKTETDGRMFPTTDSSRTIIDCIMDTARRNGVKIRTQNKVQTVHFNDTTNGETKAFRLVYLDDNKILQSEYFDSIVLATGSSQIGFDIASSLNHTIIPPVPSLFTFNTKNQNKEGQIFYDLAGVSVPLAQTTLKLKVSEKKKPKIITQEGPLLITHHGISGPAVLRLSAFAAREMKDLNYQTEIVINWAPKLGTVQEVEEKLWSMTVLTPQKTVSSFCPLMIPDESTPTSAIPRRLWSAFCVESDIDKSITWAEVSKKKVSALSKNIVEFKADVTGKGVFKDEFVTAGGVSLKEVDMTTMESKLVKGLYFCGEILDVDGITGGFNFMNCWSTGYVSGKSAAESHLNEHDHINQ